MLLLLLKATIPGNKKQIPNQFCARCCTGNYKFWAEKISNTQKMGGIGQEEKVMAEEGS